MWSLTQLYKPIDDLHSQNEIVDKACVNKSHCSNIQDFKSWSVENLQRRPHDACSSPRYDSGGMDYITLVAPSATVFALCPHLVETNGLRIAATKNHIRSDQCQDSAVKVVGCRSHETLEFLSTCETVREHMTFQCQGTWEENGRNYLIAGLKGSKVRYCFVYYSNPKMTQFSGLPDTCRRTIVPGVTGNLTFNITSAGECDNLLNSSPSLKFLSGSASDCRGSNSTHLISPVTGYKPVPGHVTLRRPISASNLSPLGVKRVGQKLGQISLLKGCCETHSCALPLMDMQDRRGHLLNNSISTI
ncbi:uncharacterized protein CEXT_293341 [Caerostris extrusa]|uniref:DUF7042 domain-containing protein n=1 Tax=Caerostris extrusa TaxID=172846 RepID=A0AAV4P2R0_CAEEX|nr:uncharacterized protein CEXT_293341 [Caerostris extrusa]